MRRMGWSGAGLAAFCWVVGVASCRGQADAAGESKVPVVHLETQGGKTEFCAGDPIVLELVFRNPGIDPWMLSSMQSGESIAIMPAKGWTRWRTPHSSDMVFLEPLTSAEARVRIGLTSEYVFREPGHYDVSMTTSRMKRGAAQDTGGYVAVTTNTVGIDIRLRPEKDEAELVQSLTRQIVDPNGQQSMQAAARLASLQGDDAVREKVHWLQAKGTNVEGVIGDGMAVSRNLELQLKLLEAVWNDVSRSPDFALERALDVTRHFMVSDRPIGDYPMFLPDEPAGDESTQKRKQAHDADLDEMIESLRSRRGQNLEETLEYLTENNKLSPQQLERVKPLLVAEFPKMEPMKQADLLQSGWSQIDDPGMASTLLAMMHGSPLVGYGYLYVLQRLIEVDPESAKPYVVRAICDGGLGNADSIAKFPARTLPEVDACLLDVFSNTKGQEPRDWIGWRDKALMLARFGSAQIYPEVLVLYKSQTQWSDDVRGAVIAYLTRWHPETVMSMLPPDQWRTFSNVALSFDVAIKLQGDGYPAPLHDYLRRQVAAGSEQDAGYALFELSRQGSQEDAAIAITRLDRLMKEWNGRTAEWTVARPTPQAKAASELQQSLIQLLWIQAYDTAWHLPETERQRIRKLCVGEWCTQFGWDPRQRVMP